MDAVARELSPRDSKVARWWSLGGDDGACEVVRSTARWRDKVFGLDIRASFDNETLSLTMPMKSFISICCRLSTFCKNYESIID